MAEELYIKKLNNWSANGQLKDICIKIIDTLRQTNPEELKILTFTSLKNMVGVDAKLEDIIPAVNVLSSDQVNVLVFHALFVDGEKEYELSSDELLSLEEHNNLVHPQSGELIEDFEKHIIPYYVPSSEFLENR